MTNHPTTPPLVVLAVLHGVMMAALMTQTPPHPPQSVAIFGMGPFLGAVLALITASLLVEDTRVRTALIALVVVASLLSFGPQKYVDPAFPQIWPAVLCAQGAVLSACWVLARGLRGANRKSAEA